MVEIFGKGKLIMISKLIFILIFLSGLTVSGMSADFVSISKEITPYGDYCRRMSHYGMHKSIIDLKHAEEALRHYYGKKGLSIEIVDNKGRFLKVKIKDNNTVVDIIVFDRNSGRIRSVY